MKLDDAIRIIRYRNEVPTGYTTLGDAADEVVAEVERLRAGIAHTADGQPAFAGTVVYTPDGSFAVVPGCCGNGAPITNIRMVTYRIDETYSTLEAAKAAGGNDAD